VALGKLLQTPTQKATVGTVLCLSVKGTLYVLLAQERGGKNVGTFSDLGGSASIQETLMNGLLRELKEESMGVFAFSAQDIQKNGHLITSQSAEGRKIYYVVYALPPEMYVPAFAFNNLSQLFRGLVGLPACYAEKSNFMWVRLSDLLNSTPEAPVAWAQTLTQGTQKITLRGYFVRDFIQNPQLPLVTKRLKTKQ
jgi:ADP-ribose pyrophosphatase YjhB (NUDIX family)